jgi:2-polyprenyl-3-methyl-5-hydroxy-6-metoxy-1,4-benzoquinol methylase
MSHYTKNRFDPTRKNSAWVNLVGFVPEGSRVLDIGCSSGHLGQELVTNKHCEVVGLDIDQGDVKLAKKVLTAAYVRNIEHDGIDDLGMFDVVMFADVLEHLLDPVAALNKAKAQLKEGGRIVFSIPNMSHLYVRLQILEGYLEYSPIGVLDRTHLHYYDEVEVKHIFAEAFLSIKAIHPEAWTFPVSLIADRLKRLGLAIANQKKLLAKLNATRANVWQFVGYAVPTTKRTEVKRAVHYVMPPEEFDALLTARTNALQTEKDVNKELRPQIARMEEFYRNPVKGTFMRLVRRARVIRSQKRNSKK